MTPLLELIGASRTFDDGHLVHALRPTGLHVHEGDYVSITGPSGSGKSTLLNLLGLLDRPSGGQYLVRGVGVEALDEVTLGSIRCQMFGFIFQAFHLLPRRTALENVEIGMLYGFHRPAARRRRAVATLERLGLGHRMHADPRTLSGGERQRVAIARAVAGRPAVLFCDEPTGNLDSANGQNVLTVLAELNRDGLTVVTVTHDAEVARAGNRRFTVVDGVVSTCD